MEEVEKMDASKIYPRRDDAKEVLISPKRGEFCIPDSRWYSKIVRKRLRIPRNHSKAGTHRMECGELQDESEESQPAEPTDDAEAQHDFWSIQGDFIYRHHAEPRVQLCVPREERIPIPLKYIDVASSTHTNLDVVQEKRI